jgi:hypothetical protein
VTKVDSPILQSWQEARAVTAAELTRDTPIERGPQAQNTSSIASSSVYTLAQVVKGAQEGGLVSQQAVVVSQAPVGGTPTPTTVLVEGIAGATVVTSAAGTATIAEDNRLEFGFQQLEQ